MPALTIADLENAKLDVDHIAAIATSTAPTVTDRLGRTKQTIQGSLGAIDDAVDDVETARNTAINASIPAAVALVDAAVAATAAGSASASAAKAEAARDAAYINADVYTSTSIALSVGVLAVLLDGGGPGNTNGTFALAFSGGGGTGAAGTYTVTGGVVVAADITNPGTGYTSPPAVTFPGAASPPTATAVVGNRVALGQQFQVVSADLLSYQRYRHDAGPVATPVGPPIPTLLYIASRLLDGFNRSGYAWGVMDANNRLAAFIDLAGRFGTHDLPNHAGSLIRLNNSVTDYPSRSGYAWGVVDANGRIALGLDLAGNLVLKGVNFGPILDPGLPARLVGIEKFITPSVTRIVCVGDSLTQGAGGTPYSSQLATLSGRTVVNRGLGGQASDPIIARQGGNGVTVTVAGNSIPASGPVNVTGLSINLLNNAGGSGSIAGTLCGVPGTLSWTTAGGYVFTRTAAGAAVVCYPGSVFRPTLGEDPFSLNVFWLGRNQFNYAQSAGALALQAANIKANYAAAISVLKPVDKRFIILGVSSGSDSFEFVGTDNHTAKRTLAADLSKLYPDNFIDIDTVLVNSGTGAGQDLTDFSNGIVPSSLRNDSQHLNTAGYLIVAQTVHNHITQKGW